MPSLHTVRPSVQRFSNRSALHLTDLSRAFRRLFFCGAGALFASVLLVCTQARLDAQSLVVGPATGTPANGSYAGSPDQLNLGNLNVHLAIPLFKKPGRGIDYEYDLSYDSSIWYNDGGGWVPKSDTQWGWNAGPPQMFGGFAQAYASTWVCNEGQTPPQKYITTVTNFVYTTADGVVNTFPGTATRDVCKGTNTGIVAQSSHGYTLNATTAQSTITDPSGNTFPVGFHCVNESGQPCSGTSVGFSTGVSTPNVTDRNGNFVEAVATPYTAYQDTADTLPVKVTADLMAGYQNELDTHLPASLQYTDPNGNTQTITVQSQTFTVRTNFGVPGVAEYGLSGTQWTFPTGITLPDSSTYLFTYEATPGYLGSITGRLASVTLPTGGMIAYQYTGGYNGIESDGSVAGLNRITSDGTSQYVRSNVVPASGTTNGSSTTTVTDPYKNQTVISFQEFASTNNFYEVERQLYSGPVGGTPLRTMATCYNSNATSCNSAALSVPFTEIYKSTTLENGLTSASDLHFNAAGLLTQTSEYDYNSSSPTRTTTISYAALGNNIQDRPQTVTQTDGSGNQLSSVTFGYDDSSCSLLATSGVPGHKAVTGSRGNLTTTTTWVNSSTSIVTHTCSDDTGQMRGSTDPSGNITQYTYDNATNTFLTGVTYPTPSSGVALSTSATYDPSTGAVLTVTDVNSGKTTIAYDSSVRPQTITSPPFSAGTPIASFTYPTSTQTNASKATGDGSTATVEILVDGYGRKSRSATYNGQAQNPYYQQDTCYDAAGRVSFVSEPYQGTGFGTAAICSGSGDATNYDALSRPTTITHADGSSYTYVYGGRTVETIAEGNGSSTPLTRALQSDGLGRLSSVCEITSTALVNSGAPSACGLDIGGLTGYSTAYAYNLAQHMTTVTQGAQSRVFQADGAGRTILATEPERGTTTYGYSYNRAGLQVVRTRPRANQGNPAVTTATTTQYDSLGRATSISYNDGLTPNKAYYFDALPAGLGWSQSLAFPKGQLVATTSGSGATATGTAMSYDSSGNVVQLWSCAPSICGTSSQSSRSESFSYDLMGNLIMEQDPTSGVINYGRSAAGEITSVTNATYTDPTNMPQLVTNVVNSPFGPTSYTQGNGLQAVRTYDSLGHNNGQYLCVGSLSVDCAGGSQELYGVNDSYVGPTVVHSCDTVPNQCQAHGYDAFNRLVSVTDQSHLSGDTGSFTYTYDRYGNRWTQTPGTSGPAPNYTFNQTNNQIVSLSYDVAGNLLTDGIAHSYTYDAEGNVLAVDSGSTAQYVYDAQNHRVRVQTAAQLNEYLFDASGQRVSTWNVANNFGTEGRIYADGQQIAFRNGPTYMEGQNWLGTERMRTDYLGHAATTEKSLSFGDGFVQTVFDSGSDVDNKQFAGQDYDAESSTLHADFRQYSSTQGRWMSPDPYDGSYDLGNPQSFNRYAYSLNNPLSMTDPSGLFQLAPGNQGSADWGGACPTATRDAGYPLYLLEKLLSTIFQGGVQIGRFLNSGSGSDPAPDPALGYGGLSAGGTFTTGYQNIAISVQQPLSSVNVLGRNVGITYGNGLSLSDELAASGKIGAAAGLIDANADSLTASQKTAIGQISSFTVAGPGTFLGATGKGSMTLSAGYIEASSAAWIGSLFGHEGQHYLNAGKYSGYNLWRDEQSAGRTQLGIGNKIGFGSSESRYLEQWIDDRNRTAMQQHMQQGYSY